MSNPMPNQGQKEDVRLADHAASRRHIHLEESGWNVDGPAFEAFDAHLDCELVILESRWIHTAAPQSAGLRRAFLPTARRVSDQV